MFVLGVLLGVLAGALVGGWVALRLARPAVDRRGPAPGELDRTDGGWDALPTYSHAADRYDEATPVARRRGADNVLFHDEVTMPLSRFEELTLTHELPLPERSPAVVEPDVGVRIVTDDGTAWDLLVTEAGATFDPREQVGVGLEVPMHLVVAGGVVWVSVMEPSEGTRLSHGPIRTQLSPVPLPLRTGSKVVNGRWALELSDQARARPAGEFLEVAAAGLADSSRVAVVLDCFAVAPRGAEHAAMLALSYVPGTVAPLDDAFSRARKHASYLHGVHGAWDALLVAGPRLRESTVGHPGLVLSRHSETPRPRHASRVASAELSDGDSVQVSAATKFPETPIDPHTFIWRAIDPPALADASPGETTRK